MDFERGYKMIIEEIDESLFISRFEDYKRVSTPENENGNFSYEGLRNLFQYLENTTEEDNPLKLDVIALCCDFTEYADIEDFLNNYSNYEKKQEEETEEDFIKRIEEEINDNTTLIKFAENLDEGFIIANY